MNPLLFLDIDGVLNTHDANRYRICGIHADKVELLNRIVEATAADVALSSAWRYMILGGAMTLSGFRYLLQTHGLGSHVSLVGHTVSDEEIPERGAQIAHYLNACGRPDYVVLDDGGETPPIKGALMTMTCSLGSAHFDRWIQVDGRVGLTEEDAQRAINLLQRDAARRTA